MMPLSDIAAHMRACYPDEGCGLVLKDAKGALTFRPIPNIAGSTDTSSRTQRDGYVMDPKALLSAMQEGDLWAIVHSHPDVGAYFSKEDRDMALGDGEEPLWPGVRYLVVSVRAGRVEGARIYTWDSSRGDFAEEEVIGIIE